jgi:RNA polymerase sigma-70 factor (ECF subfamily)
MIDTTRTTTQLLQGLLNPENSAAWAYFDARYRPILLAVARRVGLDDADAADVAQETVLRFLSEYRVGHYDRERGRLRAWVLTIARSRIAGLRRFRATRREVGPDGLPTVPEAAELETHWMAERRRVLLQQAMRELQARSRVEPKTMRAFELHVVREMPAAEVAEELGMSRHDVYLAKSRVTARLRDILGELERAFDGEEP